ncbi:MAG TPA: hypothetical protein VNT51_02180 [Miltoncostaeaceae bacterium]|nr:hypothetical protein [Miltoncostaeaceae bacterium]
MADTDAEITELRERIDRLRAEMRGTDVSGQAGEMAHYDQHQADSGTALADRESTVGVIAELEERLRRLEAGLPEQPERYVPPSDPDDVSTPLDEPAPREQLNAIPMGGTRADLEADPQEEDDQPYMAMPGEVYTGEQGPPQVGRPDEDDGDLERTYRPQ